MERESTDMKEMCLKLDTASFLPCTVMCACIHQLSQDGHSILCNHSVFAHCIEGHREPPLQPEPQLRNAESTRKMARWEHAWRSPEDHRVESQAELACESASSQWTLMKSYRILGES